MTMKKAIRKITISYSRFETMEKIERVPFIRLQGKWLTTCGFTLGEKVTVEADHKKLIIRLADKI